MSTTPCANTPPLTSWANYNGNNQFTNTNQAPGGVPYDASGDVLNDGVNQYLYDAEGRICAVASTPAPGMTTMTGYLYDAEGTRVGKGSISAWTCDLTANGFQPTTDYILGPGGEQVSEMNVTVSATATTVAWAHTNVWAAGRLLATYDPTGLHFYLDDPLGTRRVEATPTGLKEQVCSSLPFGDGQTCSATPTEHLFTGKERDTESGNDYFGARYYASSMGRFISPDWAAKAMPVPYAIFGNPQSLNLYSYMRNNPLGGVDANGHCDWCQKFGNWARGDGFVTNMNLKSSVTTTETYNLPGSPSSTSNAPTTGTASPGTRIVMGAEAVANTVVGIPKVASGAAALVVGTLGSETGVGAGVAVTGAYELAQGSGQLTSALLQAGGALTGDTKGVDEKVDQVTATTSIVGATATFLNGGDYHAGAKWAAAEGVFSGSFRQDLLKGVSNTIDTILNTKEIVTP
jgi:RHS repeat-associated protein